MYMRNFPAPDYYINQAFSVYLAGIGLASAAVDNNNLNQPEGYKIRQPYENIIYLLLSILMRSIVAGWEEK
jgi:hypothetical protein